MPSFQLEFEVFCGNCGAGLCNTADTRSSRTRSMPQVTVPPCAACMAKERAEGYEEGADKGYDNGYKDAVAEIEKTVAA